MTARLLKHLPKAEKDRVRELLESTREHMKKQNELYHELFLLPNERAIEMISGTLKPGRDKRGYPKGANTIEECKQCLSQTAARYKEIHALFKGKEIKRVLRKANKIRNRHLYNDHDDFTELHNFIKEELK